MDNIINIGVQCEEGFVGVFSDKPMDETIKELQEKKELVNITEFYQIKDKEMEYYCFDSYIWHYKT